MLGYTLGADDGANLLVVPALNRHQDIQGLELPNTWPGNHKAPSFFCVQGLWASSIDRTAAYRAPAASACRWSSFCSRL